LLEVGIMKLTLSVLFVLFPTLGFGADAYKCEIHGGYGLVDSGEFVETAWAKMWVGREFIVDKDSGKMIGGFSNSGTGGDPKVLDRGSTDQAFKVITIYKPMTAVDYLYVQEFNENAEKPFFL
jgi:hypothetical protein